MSDEVEYVLVSDMEGHSHPSYGEGYFCTPDAIKGGVLVPSVPTQKMIDAGWNDAVQSPQSIWSAMLTAAPQMESKPAREKIVGLQVEARPMHEHYAVLVEITEAGADAVLKALRATGAAS